ncbi:hypothetical protein SAMN05192559_102266 [Halobacillus karajensis]|uniref:Uncharacterized protein n=1 Tax=Halobacillus karajensis TaxID=195088 RepID=A0A024P6R3_9BACI|nr:hypothetical protein [Halobacillus karajensis]CDQ17997.1 hypothetical protein BN982_00237 [Halobacillus karajensis]CDQ24346.1 hypothetical protein BN983_02620 [Halobacillus karajensis]CDQ29405.1 hypothetical protein BN981_03786 [Halobacillus karajensis]SEH61244.1 hypothetical protein SAMN05192559_102266 [Halobacillus karajensis]
MRKVWLYWILGPLALAILIASYTYYFKEEAVIKYFPLDEGSGFKSFGTSLNFASQEDDDEYEISWNMGSESNKSMYLRQDVSLLYVNGRLKGVVSKWEENTAEIEKETSLHGEDSQKYQAISFHHGEIHKGKDPIKSIQATSKDELYVIDSPHTKRTAFKKPSNEEEKEWKKRLDHSIRQQLEVQWEELITNYGINKDAYTLVPLTKLADYEEQPLPGTKEEDSERIKGQLWEGLYKNYVLGISDTKSSHPIQSYIPLILFDKKGEHLIVLYEDDTGKKHRLIQRY